MTWERTKNLWEYEHPYYMHEGNYFKAGLHARFDSWQEFISEHGDEDIDMNRIHRWDFNINPKQSTVYFYYILQRKAIISSVEINFKLDELDLIKEFLKPHAELNKKLWQGVLEDEKIIEI